MGPFEPWPLRITHNKRRPGESPPGRATQPGDPGPAGRSGFGAFTQVALSRRGLLDASGGTTDGVDPADAAVSFDSLQTIPESPSPGESVPSMRLRRLEMCAALRAMSD